MTTATGTTTLLDAAFSTISDAVSVGQLPSGVLAVASSEGIVRQQSFGPVTTDSLFLIASITKSIFAAGVLRLVERGHLLLDEPVATHLPAFGANGKQDVRLWHLLTHTSGVDEAWVAQQVGRERYRWPRLVEATCAAPLRFRPGSRYEYANPPFVIMAELVERLSGVDHATYLRDNVLAPLGMADTSYAPADSPRVAPVLDPPWSEGHRADWIGLRHPAAGLWSTATDLVRFGQALLGDGELDGYQVLAPATIRAMTRKQTVCVPVASPIGDLQAYYGLGVSKTGPNNASGPSGDLRTAAGFGHGGATGTYLWIEPEYDLIFVFLTNRWGQLDAYLKRALNAVIAAASLSA